MDLAQVAKCKRDATLCISTQLAPAITAEICYNYSGKSHTRQFASESKPNKAEALLLAAGRSLAHWSRTAAAPANPWQPGAVPRQLTAFLGCYLSGEGCQGSPVLCR